MSRCRKRVRILPIVVLFAAGASSVISPAATAQEDRGEEVFASHCASCHGSDGAGVPGMFPPVAGNPNVEDAAYVEEVVRNGLSGEIVVLGATYDEQMPAFESQLSAEEISAVSDYVRSRFGTPGTPEPGEPAPPVDEEDTFPWGIVLLGATQTAFVVGLVFFLASPTKKGQITWWTAYLRAGFIFLYFVLTTAWFPSWVVSQNAVAQASRWISDLVGSAAWLVPLALGIVALRWLQEKERI